MTIRVSTGLRASLLSDYGLTAMMNYGVIAIYSDAQPENASFMPAGTLLGYVTTGGSAFVVGSEAGGALQVALADLGGLGPVGEWRLKGVATGTAGWWRWMWNSPDDGSDSTYYPRMDGAVGESLILENTSITPATDVVISTFNVNFLE